MEFKSKLKYHKSIQEMLQHESEERYDGHAGYSGDIQREFTQNEYFGFYYG